MRILAFAYSCEPGQGSEGGVGWMWSRMLARIGEVCVLTNNRDPSGLEDERRGIPEGERIRFESVRVPGDGVWQRGQRAVRLHYLLWQVGALRRARRLQREQPFDIVWHVTFANAWLGSLAAAVNAPFVYGPVGAGAGTIWRLLPGLGVRGAAYEVLRAIARLLGRYANPLARLAWRRARLILVQNPETLRWMPRRYRPKCRIFSNAVVDAIPTRSRPRSGGSTTKTALFAGRLLAWKGVGLAIRALRWAPEWQLLVCGAGRDERRLRGLSKKWARDGQVRFLGILPRHEVLGLMQEEADVLLFPSIHDEAPLTVAEALACGLPVVCLDRAGPPEIAGPGAWVIETRGGGDLSEALATALQSPRLTALAPVAERRGADFLLRARAESLAELFYEIAWMVDPQKPAREAAWR